MTSSSWTTRSLFSRHKRPRHRDSGETRRKTKKAPEEVKYIPFGRFATIHSTVFSLDVNDLSTTIDKPQMFDASHFPGMLTQLALNHYIWQFPHPMRIKNDVRRLMKRPAQIPVDGPRVVSLGGFHFPNKPVDHRIGRSSSALFAATDELHGQPCHGERLSGFILLFPEVDAWGDDYLPLTVLHTGHYTTIRPAWISDSLDIGVNPKYPMQVFPRRWGSARREGRRIQYNIFTSSIREIGSKPGFGRDSRKEKKSRIIPVQKGIIRLSELPENYHTLNLKCMTSPSWTTYSLPSWRKRPASRQPFSPFSSE